MSLTARLGRVARSAVSDISPLRESAAYRRLFAGQAVSSIGTQVTQVAVPLQVYAITHSSLDVGLASLTALVPLIFFGLYGGAIADAVDRRKLLLITSVGTMAISVVLFAQAAAGMRDVPLLFVCVATQAGFAAVDAPARRSMTPVLVRAENWAPPTPCPTAA